MRPPVPRFSFRRASLIPTARRKEAAISIFLTPKLDRLIGKLIGMPAGEMEAKLRGTLAEFDTVIAE